MLKLGSVTLGTTPRIVVPFTDKTPLDAIQHAQRMGLDIAEARVDQFESFDQRYIWEQIGKLRGTPVIATIRWQGEGGAWSLSEAERLYMYRVLLPKVDAIDIELKATEILSEVVQAAKEAEKLVIISHHNFENTPERQALAACVEEAEAAGADVVKIVTLTETRAQVRTLASLALEKAGSSALVVFGMGREGLVSRLFFPALGSLLTYAFLDRPNAPGQLHFDDTFRHLRLLYPDFNREKTELLAR